MDCVANGYICKKMQEVAGEAWTCSAPRRLVLRGHGKTAKPPHEFELPLLQKRRSDM